MSYLRMVKMAVMPCFFAFYIQQQITCNRLYVYISNLIWRVRQKENIKCIYSSCCSYRERPPISPHISVSNINSQRGWKRRSQRRCSTNKKLYFHRSKVKTKISISYKVSMYTCCCFILFYKFKLERGCTRGEQRLEGNCKPGKTEIAMSEIQ